jgi:hypothetical protein
MAVAPSAFVCGAAWARALFLFTVFVVFSVVGKLLRFGLSMRRRAELAYVEAARVRPTSAAPKPSRLPAASLLLFGCRMKQL